MDTERNYQKYIRNLITNKRIVMTQEQKEANFEKEWAKYFEHRGNLATVNIKHLARHFFELGFNAKEK